MLLTFVLALLCGQKRCILDVAPLADVVLADAILITPRPVLPPNIIWKVRGRRKSTETKYYYMKKGDVGMAIRYSKKFGNKG